jgi:histidine triad (HIT) family protein
LYNHASQDYECHFCRIANGLDNEGWNTQSDVFWRSAHVTAFINVRWSAGTPGHALVIPNKHIENIYDLTPDTATHVHEAARQIAIAFKKVCGCEGTSTRQHNEPAGYQEVFHYHLHIFPRYQGDSLYARHEDHRLTTCEERMQYAEKLRKYFSQLNLE